MDPIVQAFIYETEGMLEQMEQILLKCEDTEEFEDEDVNEIFRIMHTIKGGAGMMMFNKLADLAHHMENMFYYIREEKPVIEDISIVSDIVLEGIDFMKEYIEGIKIDDYEDLDSDDIIEKIEANIEVIKNGTSEADVDNNKVEDSSDDEEVEIKRTTSDGIPLEEVEKIELDISDMSEDTEYYRIVLRYTEGCEMENIRAFQAVGEIKASAINMAYFPDNLMEGESGPLAEIIRQKGLQVNLQTEWTYKELEELIEQIAFVDKFTIEKISPEDMDKFDDSNEEEEKENNKEKEIKNEKESPKAKKKQSKQEKKADSEAVNHAQEQKRINVPVEKLDLLMDLVGELVLSETMVISNPDLKGLKLDNFSKAARQHRKIIGEVQDIVMSIRMMPLSTTFTKMKRIVRDISKKLDRDMQIELIGEETEVDKNIIEQIGDPLMHLVRNAADHGIESKEEREAAGKTQPPVITLEACNSGGDVIIKVMDNGKGLDKDKILKKAIKNKLIEPNNTELTDRQIYQMIFLPGFSTAEQVTEFSGRGVGMDVVRNNIEGLGGTISVDSVKNEGTTVTLKIPLTLAIVSGMIIRVGKAKYTVPIMSIQESFRPSKKDIIVDTEGNEMVMVRGNCYIIRRLNRMYGVKNAEEDFEKGILIMIESNDDTFCIFADEIIGEQQVVVKPLPEYVKRFDSIHGIAGCTLLGDGDISLILDVANINN